VQGCFFPRTGAPYREALMTLPVLLTRPPGLCSSVFWIGARRISGFILISQSPPRWPVSFHQIEGVMRSLQCPPPPALNENFQGCPASIGRRRRRTLVFLERVQRTAARSTSPQECKGPFWIAFSRASHPFEEALDPKFLPPDGPPTARTWPLIRLSPVFKLARVPIAQSNPHSS